MSAKKFIVICIILIITHFIFGEFLDSISYHIELNYDDIESIRFVSDNTGEFDCNSEKEIKTAIREIKKINFYQSKKTKHEQSPISIIGIRYNDGTEQSIDFVFSDALIYTSKPFLRDGKFYQTMPNVVDKIIKKMNLFFNK